MNAARATDPKEKETLLKHLEVEKLYRSTFVTTDPALKKRGMIVAGLEANRNMLLYLESIGQGQHADTKKMRDLIATLEKELE